MKIKVDRDSDKALYIQIREAIQAAVEHGRLGAGDRLPPVAAFAKSLGVTQSTVRRALGDLTAAGIVESHVGRGTFVADKPNEAGQTGKYEDTAPGQRPAGSQTLSAAARRLRMGISRSLESLLPLLQRQDLIRFTQGIPDPELMQPGLLEGLLKTAMEKGQRRYQEYGDPQGMPELRRALAERFNREGYPVSADMIMITSGSQQAISLLALHAREKNMRVVCETPCYLNIPNAFSTAVEWVETIKRDGKGPLPEKLDQRRDDRRVLLYNCPELHNPMGRNTTAGRRNALATWARKNDSLVIDDEIFHDLQFKTCLRWGALKDGDGRHTVMVGSFSKSFMTGLRIGWMVTHPERIQTVLALKRVMDLGCPALMQGIVLAALENGAYDEHLTVVRKVYRQRCEAALKALSRHMPEGVGWTRPEGGYHMWVELPEGYSGISLMLRAVEKGVAIVPGPYSDPDHRYVNAFRLCYAQLPTQTIREGIQLLSDTVREMLAEPPGDSGLGGLGDLF